MANTRHYSFFYPLRQARAEDMLRLSMNELTTFRWTFDEDIHYYEQAGYEGIGLWLRKLEDFGEERALEILADSGLVVSNVMWAGGFTGSCGKSVVENLSEARRALAIAGQVRAGCLVLYAGGRNHHTVRHANRLLNGAIDELLPFAEKARVPLAIEPMHPACANEWTFLHSLESALELVKSYSTPWLRLVYDTYHFPLAKSRWDLLDEIAPYTAIVHVGDGDKPHDLDQERCPLGRGKAPLAGLVKRMAKAGYHGFFDVELMGSEIETQCYKQLISDSYATLQQIWQPNSLSV